MFFKLSKYIFAIFMLSFSAYAGSAVGLTTQEIANAFEGNVSNPKGNSDSGTLSIPTPPAPIIEDKEGSQFSNKIVDIENRGQIRRLKVFGDNLFSNQCSTLPQIALYNPNYLISIGDKISLTIWGAFEYADDVTVDSQGNIFLPKVGPVKVVNIPNKDLNKAINEAIKKTFQSNVVVYANLLTAQPIQIFVSGYVAKPGLYDGMSSDSILYFLCKSGGIISDQGSFRKVDLVRNEKVIKTIDLYDFLLDGVIPFSQLQQGDSIVVRAKNDSVTVIGDVKVPAEYEPKVNKDGFKIKELIDMAGVLPSATYVLIEDDRGLDPVNSYIPLSELSDQKIYGGEKITLTSDQDIKELTVSINGAILGPHQFIVPIGTTLGELKQKMQFRSNASVENLQLFRESVADAQKAAIDSSLNYLEQQAYTKSALTKDGLLMQQQYAGLVSAFVQKAKQVQPKGQVIVGPESKWDNIVLQNNDNINIPNQNQVVTISGQVMAPMALNYNDKYTVEDYINAVGGYTPTADKGYVLLLHEDGTAEQVSLGMFSFFSTAIYPRGGDQIIVPNEGMSEALPIMATISQIVFQIAIAARVFIAPF